MSEKPRHRVKANSVRVSAPAASKPLARKMTARYLRGDTAGTLAMRRAVTRDARLDVRESAERASALAFDFMQNSGWISGAVQQIITDTIGDELKLNLRSQLEAFGYTKKQASAWCRKVERAWRRFAWNPKECDLAGKATIADMAEALLLSFLASGEGFAVLDHLPLDEQRRLGLKTGLKVSVLASHRCPRTTIENEGLDQGVYHDEHNRAIGYKFRVRKNGIETDRTIDGADVIHVMDRAANLNSPRGISVIAPALKVIAQSDQLADATLATALIQTIFAATIKSPEPSESAFDAIRTLSDMEAPEGYEGDWNEFIGGLQEDLMDVWGNRIDALKNKGISMSESGRINHLGPGETFEMHSAATPGSQYLPFFQSLLKEIARCLGITYEALAMDHSNASYSSVRMAVATIWPIVMRRRSRIVAPFLQGVFERWLDEMIFRNIIPFKGGYAAFSRDRESVFQSEWSGPAAPSADDYKAALAAKVRMETGISTFHDECALVGRNGEEQIAQLGIEKRMFDAEGVPHPFGRSQGGGGGPLGAAAEGNRDPTKEAA
ncbi:phage portal protein [Agrobacterium pusense]|uniref:phage portal protein n=1 Tax=Agrobacterium pusense TaxID=648995 RepID=UPI0022B86A4B|nr:phage portal protein [Agrobacterium pusense]MCZ7927332.1 phage portal protein [Agrobacterium pusense]